GIRHGRRGLRLHPQAFRRGLSDPARGRDPDQVRDRSPQRRAGRRELTPSGGHTVMSAITIEGDLIHYEVLGRGRPVILVHGWLGSWRYWVPAMSQVSMKYRTYALDLWGFGDSGKDARHYDFASQVALLDQFMNRLGITK